MKKSFGQLHYSALFFEKIMSARSSNPEISLSAIRTGVTILKGLDALQESNPLVTHSFATDTLRVYYRGTIQFHIIAKKHRVILWIPPVFQSKITTEVTKHPNLFKPEMEPNIEWVLSQEAIEWFLHYLNKIWKPSNHVGNESEFSHPRHIPGEVRQAVLSEFLSSGQWCPGVAGLTKRHKLGNNTRIEFDHILPYSLGGSNSIHNIQVLCSNCNSLKRATAN